MKSPIQLIVGLGNPGPDYIHTRHNAGADLVAQLAQQHGTNLSENSKFWGLCGRITLAGQDIRLLIPTTFMNRSGQSVAAVAQFYKTPPEAILVVHDELDLSPGVARFKQAGGHGGHNGLRDIIKAMGNQANFARLRLGIGHPGHASQVSAYVLKRAPQEEQEKIQSGIDKALVTLPLAITGEWEKAMKELHTA